MVSVYPIRYKDKNLEFLMIKRVTPSYNWQCMTGAVEKGEIPLEAAKRELFEETGYVPALITPFSFDEKYLKDYIKEHDKEMLKIFDEIKVQSDLSIHLLSIFLQDTFPEGSAEFTFLTAPRTGKIIKNYHFIARIDQSQDPILESTEHDEWKWCSYDTAYKIIMWEIEKKNLEYVNKCIKKNQSKYF